MRNDLDEAGLHTGWGFLLAGLSYFPAPGLVPPQLSDFESVPSSAGYQGYKNQHPSLYGSF